MRSFLHWREGLRRPAALGLLLLAAASAAGAGQVELISRADPLPDSYGNSASPALSADGRWIVFQSDAPNLVPGQADGNAFSDVFLADRLTGAVTLVSHAAGRPTVAGHVAGTYYGLETSLSADGRYVAFTSLGTDLVPGVSDTNQKSDLYLYDRVTGTTTLVSHASGDPNTTANGHSTEVQISADGNWIAFTSNATNLIPGQVPTRDGPPAFNVFLYNRPAGSLTLITHRFDAAAIEGNGASIRPVISADGGFVVFLSDAKDLVAGMYDPFGANDVFLYQRATGAVTLISHAAGAPLSAANALSSNPALSADGRWIAFGSLAKNLLAGQTTAPGTFLNDLFLYDRISGSLRLVSHSAAAPQMGVGAGVAALSGDGRYVAFDSPAPGVVPGQVNLGSGFNVFVYDRVTGKTSLVSHNRDSATTSPTSPDSRQASLSADGRYIVFASSSVDLVRGQIDTPGTLDVFVYDQSARTTLLASHVRGSLATAANAASTGPRISADGGVVAFGSFATDLADGLADAQGFQDLFAFERRSAEVTPLTQRAADLPAVTPFGPSTAAGLSTDGRYVLFLSKATGLVPGQVDKPWWNDDPLSGFSGTWDVFLRDRATGKTTLLSRSKASPPTAAGGDSAVISADGSAVAFRLRGTGSFTSSLLLYDRATDALRLVNHSLSPVNEPSGALQGFPVLSADGRFAAYACDNCRLVPGQQNGASAFSPVDVFLYDRTTGANTLISHASGDPLTTGSLESHDPWISADGNVVAFTSLARNLVPGQSSADGSEHAFVFDRATGAVTLIDHAAASPATATGHGTALAGMSADGRWIVFASDATDLVPGQVDTNRTGDLFLYDRLSGTASLISHASSSPLTTGNDQSYPYLDRHRALISADGRWTVFYSVASDLVAGVSDTNDGGDVFLYDRLSGAVSLVSSAAGSPGSTTSLWAQSPVISADGSRIGFQSPSPELLPGQTGTALRFYVQDRATGARTLLAGVVGKSFGIDPNISLDLWMSAGGLQTAFTSDASGLVAGDFNANWDAFLYDAAAGPVTVPPCALFDGALRSNVQRTVAVVGACGVPAGARQAILKVTVSQGTGKGNVRLYPGDATSPPSGILRFSRGMTQSAGFTVPLGNGAVAVLPFVAGNGTVRVSLEVDGYVP